jgi:hypothetical protein
MRHSGARSLVVLGAVVVALVACGDHVSNVGSGGSAPAWAQQRCGAQGASVATGYGPGAFLVGTFGVTGSQLAAWQEKPRGPGAPRVIGSVWRNRATEDLAVCYFDGTFSNLGPTLGGPRGADYSPATPPPPFARVILVVDSLGGTTLYAAGNAASLPLQDPAAP